MGGTAGFENQSVEIFNETENYSTLTLSPNLGYFVIDNLAVGGLLEIEAYGGDSDGSLIAFSPFVRYYFAGAGDARFFGQGRIGFGSQDFGDNVDAESFFNWGLGAGVDYFLNDHVAIEGLLGFESLKFENGENPINTFGLRIGIQAFLGGGGSR